MNANTEYDRDTALEVLKALSKHMYPSYDLYGNKTLVIDRDKFETVRKQFLDRPIYTHCSAELNKLVAELMEDYRQLTRKAKSFGLDIRLYDQSETLELYYNDDYPDTLLVDKDLSSKKKGEKC